MFNVRSPQRGDWRLVGAWGWMLGALLFAGCGRKVAPPAVPPTEVAVVTIAPEPVVLTTELPGRTTPYVIAEIRPQVSGLIQKRLFTEGADVQTGQALYQIDPAPFQAMLDKAKANLTAVQSRAKRAEELLATKAVSQQDFDDADAALKQVEAETEMARINLAYTKITAPISGRIGKSSVTDGAIVMAYQPVPLATIQQLDPIYVDVPQSTADLLRLQPRLADGRLTRDGNDQNAVQLILEDGTKYPSEGTLQFRDISVDPTTATVTFADGVPESEWRSPAGYVRPSRGERRRQRTGHPHSPTGGDARSEGKSDGADCQRRRHSGAADAHARSGRSATNGSSLPV